MASYIRILSMVNLITAILKSNQYTNCDLNHNFQTFNFYFSVYKHELLIMMWKVGNKNCIKARDMKLITFIKRRWWDDYSNIATSFECSRSIYILLSGAINIIFWFKIIFWIIYVRASLRHERMRLCLSESCLTEASCGITFIHSTHIQNTLNLLSHIVECLLSLFSWHTNY